MSRNENLHELDYSSFDGFHAQLDYKITNEPKNWGETLVGRNIANTGGPSSSCEIIILHNSHGVIIRVCMRIFTTALRNKTIHQILNKNNTPYFHSVSLVIWPFTLTISRFSTYIRKAFLHCDHSKLYWAISRNATPFVRTLWYSTLP